MVYPSSQTGDTIPNFLSYVYQPSYRPPKYPQGCSPPGTLVGASMSSNDVDPYQISWTDNGPDQTSLTDVGLGLNIINRHMSRFNSFFPLPQLPFRSRDWSHPIGASTKYFQHTSRLQQYPSGCEHLTRQTPRLCLTLRNRHSGPTNLPQPTPWLDESLSTDARAFEPIAATPPEAVWNIHWWWSSEVLVGYFLHHYGGLNFFCILIPVWLALSCKSQNNRHEVRLQSYDRTLINPKD